MNINRATIDHGSYALTLQEVNVGSDILIVCYSQSRGFYGVHHFLHA